MEHSPKYEQVKYYWENSLWNETRLRNAVLKKWITADEFTEITGIDYNTPDTEAVYVRPQQD